MKSPKFSEVNKSVRKVDALGLACGQAKFTDDYDLPGMLYGKLLRSPYAHARIKSIRTAKAKALPGVAEVFTYRDVPRIPNTTAGQGYPEPSPYDDFLLDNKVRFVGDKVALVAAETEEIAEDALKLIEVDYEELPAVLDPRKAMRPSAPVIHDEKDCHLIIPVPYEPEKNRAFRVEAEVGDVEKGVKQADQTVEDEFENQTATHSALEPHCALSWLDENNRLNIISTTQVPYHARRIVSRFLEIPVKRIRIIKPRLGGGFGGKQEVLLEQYVGLITLRTGRPAKMRFTRKEVFVSARVRHNMITKVQVAAEKDGSLTAIDLYALSNTGAYGSHGLTVASNVGTRTLPMFNCPNLRFTSDVVYTNLTVSGAYRGYGGTQGILATAIAMDDLAERLGMDPVDFYLKNVIRGGTEVPILKELGEGPVIGLPHIGSCELAACIRAGAEAIDWKKRRGHPGGGRFRRGIGMAVMMQGSSIPYIDMASAFIKMNDDGSFNLLMGATEIGQGSDTVLSQIAAEVLSVKTEDIMVYSSDTDLTPFDVGAYASSTTYLSGMAVKETAEKVREQILRVGAKLLKVSPERVRLRRGKVVGPKKASVTLREIGTYSLYQEDQFQIAASSSRTSEESPPPFAAHFVEVEVDRATGKVRVLEYVQAVDCGTVINPVLARGQALGALINGISYALVERYIYNSKGVMLNSDYGYYKIFSARDVPPRINTIFVPSYESSGPFGAKSVGEICISGPLPAISNAIYDAVDVRLHRTPFTPDKVLEAIQARERG